VTLAKQQAEEAAIASATAATAGARRKSVTPLARRKSVSASPMGRRKSVSMASAPMRRADGQQVFLDNEMVNLVDECIAQCLEVLSSQRAEDKAELEAMFKEFDVDGDKVLTFQVCLRDGVG